MLGQFSRPYANIRIYDAKIGLSSYPDARIFGVANRGELTDRAPTLRPQQISSTS